MTDEQQQEATTAEVAPVEEPTVLAAPAPPDAASVTDITRLLHTAVEQNIPVETMERLVALHERMSDRAAAAEFAAALARFQRACPLIARTSRADIVSGSGAKFSYNYAELDEIVRTIRDLLHECGLSYSWDSKVGPNGMLECTCTLTHVKGHKSQASFACPTESRAGMSAAQKVAAALTFARRQTLVQVLGLTTCDSDTDAVLGSVAPISAEQVQMLANLITEVGADVGRFLKYMGVATLAEIQERHYAGAVAALQQKRKAVKR